MSDWTVAVDDGLTQRLRHCTTCGKRLVTHWGLCGIGPLAIAYVLCRACRERDPHLRQIEAFLDARYGGAGEPRVPMDGAHDRSWWVRMQAGEVLPAAPMVERWRDLGRHGNAREASRRTRYAETSTEINPTTRESIVYGEENRPETLAASPCAAGKLGRSLPRGAG